MKKILLILVSCCTNIYADKQILVSKNYCMKKSIYNINHDNLGLGYKLDQSGRNFYYIYSVGQCQAIDDFNKGISIRDQTSFHKVAFPNSKEQPINSSIGKIYTSQEASIAWKGYYSQYFSLMAIGKKVYK